MVAIHHGLLPFIVIIENSKKKYLSKFVLPSWLESSRNAADAFISVHLTNDGNSEISVWRANQVSKTIVYRRTDIEPMFHIVASKKNLSVRFAGVARPITTDKTSKHSLMAISLTKR